MSANQVTDQKRKYYKKIISNTGSKGNKNLDRPQNKEIKFAIKNLPNQTSPPPNGFVVHPAKYFHEK